jgi:thiamine biosynthesis lipoprotein
MAGSSEWGVVEQTRRIMATRMSIHISVPPHAAGLANAAIARAMAWLETLSNRITRFSADSELARLNDSAGEWHPVSGLLFTLIAESIAAARATNGLFDPALLPLLEALGYDRDYDDIEHRETGQRDAAPFVAGRWRDIELDASRLRVLLPPGVRLDLGGIAKGWAADAVLARHLSAYDNTLINAGGDMRARGGAQPDEPWAVGIGNPLTASDDEPSENSEPAAVLTLGRGGLATSGATGRWWIQNGVRQHHLLDPRTGRPIPLWIDARDRDPQSDASSLIATATALAATAAHAEVAAKVALLRGYPAAIQQIESAWDASRAQEAAAYGDAGIALLLILGDGRIVCSANLHEFLSIVGGGGDVWLG